jgi:hypothetical protein
MTNQIKNKDILYCKNYSYPIISNDILDTIGEFIFIVDMPNMGGGVTFFMDTITSYYKKTVNIVIARNFKKMLHLYINNEYILEAKYNVDESITFIEKYQHKIKKILFNHTIDHQKRFIDKLFTINKHTTYITHDYYILCNKPNIYYPEIYLLHKTNRAFLDLNLFDTIITQNEVNNGIYKEYYKKAIEVIELPDFKNTKQLIKTNNSQIVVGIIGAISIEKGKEVLDKIISFYKDSNISFVVFGYVQIPNFINYHPYKDIEELNNLLVQHKPNMLLELSLSPETYSYTLSISMITQLPIIYLKKRFPSVVENRLAHYNKKHSFTNYKELSVLFNKCKQDFFNTIEENIFFDTKWSDYFLNTNTNTISNISNNNLKPYFQNIEGKNIVFITSKLIVSDKAFSYVKKRSLYSRQERMTQTLKTINSVRQFIPDSHIVLLDNSILNTFEKSVFGKLTDTFINITDNNVLNYYTDVFEYKAFGEISQTLQFLDLFFQSDYTGVKNFFKITGRYEINSDFDYKQYDNNLNIFKKSLSIKEKDYYYTCFYKLDKSILKEVQAIFEGFIKNKEKYMNNDSDLEVIFPNAIINKVHSVDSLGIIENIGVWKKITNI